MLICHFERTVRRPLAGAKRSEKSQTIDSQMLRAACPEQGRRAQPDNSTNNMLLTVVCLKRFFDNRPQQFGPHFISFVVQMQLVFQKEFDVRLAVAA